jgi:uncharacterized protein (TIGR04222 family)
MNAAQSKLWDRIAALEIDDPESSLTFSRRLSRENLWAEPFAYRVVEEYRRFLFLAMAAGHPVTPSDQVDQAWHLHLTYTRSYWEDLCHGVLGHPLHHGPTRGGAQESAKFHDWYERTLDSYRGLFGTEPPPDIWPPAADRFGRDLHFARVNLRDHWVLPRPSSVLRGAARRVEEAGRPAVVMPILAVVAVLCLFLVGCAARGLPMGGMDLKGRSGPEFLHFFVPLTLGAVACSIMLRRWAHAQVERVEDPDFAGATKALKDPSKLDPYALILLARGPSRIPPVQAAVARLVDEGSLTFNEEEKRLGLGEVGEGRTFLPIEHAVIDAVEGRVGSSGWETVKAVSGSGEAAAIEDQLRGLGLIHSASNAMRMRLAPILPLGVVLLLGLWRMALGIQRDRPVGYLVLLCGLLVVTLVLHLMIRPWRNPRGDSLYRTLLRVKPQLKSSPEPPSSPAFPMAFALMGMAALPSTGKMATLQRGALLPPPSDGSGGGCGGGGDGGGGGGCGGGGCGGGGCGG